MGWYMCFSQLLEAVPGTYSSSSCGAQKVEENDKVGEDNLTYQKGETEGAIKT